MTKAIVGLFAFLFLASEAGSQAPAVKQPATPINFPVLPTPAPVPPPTPDPTVVPKLVGEQLYVIGSDVPGIVRTSPKGLAKVTTVQGPMTVSGKFIDGSGKREIRVYKERQVFQIEAMGVGRVEILFIPLGLTDETQIISKTIDVDDGTGPRPPPGPTPDPKPPDPPAPEPKPPIPGEGLKVIMVYEQDDFSTLPESRKSILFYPPPLADYLKSKSAIYRTWDKDTDMSQSGQVWQDAMKRPRTALPWIIISTAKTGYEGPLPNTLQETLDLVKKYGEAK